MHDALNELSSDQPSTLRWSVNLKTMMIHGYDPRHGTFCV